MLPLSSASIGSIIFSLALFCDPVLRSSKNQCACSGPSWCSAINIVKTAVSSMKTSACINISEQSKTERNRSKQNRDYFKPADSEKDDEHQDLYDTGGLAFWAKQMFQEASDAVGLNRPDKPHHEEYGRHRSRHVQVRVATPQQRPINMEISRTVVVTPADCSDSRNQSEPVHEQNKNENRGKKPKSLLHEVTADDVFQEIVQTLD